MDNKESDDSLSAFWRLLVLWGLPYKLAVLPRKETLQRWHQVTQKQANTGG